MRRTYEIIVARNYEDTTQNTLWEVIEDIFDGMNGLDLRTQRKVWLSPRKGQYRYVFVSNKKELKEINIIFDALKRVYGFDYTCNEDVSARIFPPIMGTLKAKFARA